MTLLLLWLLLFSICVGALADVREGSTRIQTYHVNTTIESRLAQTSVSIDFVNDIDCPTVLGFTMQLPRFARVTSLYMHLSDGCTQEGEVKELDEAVETFDESASEGKPAAILSAWDSTNYQLQLLIPPLGTTQVEIRSEELLRRRRHRVDFQVPLSPGLPVEQILMDVTIQEPHSGVSDFGFDPLTLGNIEIDRGTLIATAHYELAGISDDDELPRLLRGYYDPGPLPEDGLLYSDGFCFVHLFNPESLLDVGPLDRSIVFVIDVSGSMTGQKLADAKAAFGAMIETLTSSDYFSIQTFSDNGSENLWGPTLATEEAKSSATTFVNALETISGTNLHDAYIDGIIRAKSSREGEQYVPIVMILTDGQATTGITDSRQISRDVKDANEGGTVKIFALAFGEGADLPLLLGISVQNGGLAIQIYEGFGDAVVQMEDFYVGELGTVLLSDIDILLTGDFEILSGTRTDFPVLADGAELSVRGRLASSDTLEGILRATTTANSAQGSNSWTTELVLVPDETAMSYNCFQAYAHARITELWNYRLAAMALGDELEPYIDFSQDQAAVDQRQDDIVARIEAEALALALEAGVVWPELTAMVTVENPACASSEVNNEDVELCYDGDALDGAEDGDYGDEEGPAGSGGYYGPTSAGASFNYLLAPVCALFAMVLMFG